MVIEKNGNYKYGSVPPSVCLGVFPRKTENETNNRFPYLITTQALGEGISCNIVNSFVSITT